MIWDLLSLIVMSGGNAELCVTVLNRLYGIHFSRRILEMIRRLHDVAVLGFPIVVLLGPGLSAPRLFLTGQWDTLPGYWIAIFMVCMVGVGGLIASTLTWWLRTRRCMACCEFSTIVSAASTNAGDDPTPAHLRFLKLIPGNQQFQIEVNEKSLTPAGWPEALDGLSILHLSDWHLSPMFPRPFYEIATREASKVRADLVVFTGDLFDDLACLPWLESTLGTLSAPLGMWFILGNHDSWHDHPRIRQEMSRLGWTDLGGRMTTIDAGAASFAIAGDETPWLGQRPMFDRTGELPRILLAHTPDSLYWAAEAGVDVMLAGHNHGGQVLLPIIGPVYSPSLHGCRYPSGIFSRRRTMMHVSRGLAGGHPLRVGCRPEITTITIRAPRRAMHLADASRIHNRPASRSSTGTNP